MGYSYMQGLKGNLHKSFHYPKSFLKALDSSSLLLTVVLQEVCEGTSYQRTNFQ